MAYIKLEFSKSAVNRAGEVLIGDNTETCEFTDALKIINNWRYSHIYPMQKVKQTLDRRTKKIDNNAITAQRLKRLPSIQSKLKILGNSKLARMQDIGGCRAIVKNIKSVTTLLNVYEEANAKSPAGRSKLIRTTDYIENPRITGYRSIHLLFEYESNTESRLIYNGHKIEVQIRTRLQHSWATAVETASTFLGQKLKSGIGDERWLRFFALASSVFAMKENCPLVSDTPISKIELINELKNYWQELNVEVFLNGCIITINESERGLKEFDRVLLMLNSEMKELSIQVFRKEELFKATEALAMAEKESAIKPEIDAVLVEVNNLVKLRFAYPNYYADTNDFVKTLANEIGVEI